MCCVNIHTTLCIFKCDHEEEPFYLNNINEIVIIIIIIIIIQQKYV